MRMLKSMVYTTIFLIVVTLFQESCQSSKKHFKLGDVVYYTPSDTITRLAVVSHVFTKDSFFIDFPVKKLTAFGQGRYTAELSDTSRGTWTNSSELQPYKP